MSTTRWIAGGHNHPGTTIPANVTGDCSHLHRTPEGAARCVAAHDAAVKRGHGCNAYSDRAVIEVEVVGGRSRKVRA